MLSEEASYQITSMMLTTISYGSSGSLVETWQSFLRGQGFYLGVVSGDFDQVTSEATKGYQTKYKLTPDGVVGNRTWGHAMSRGLDIIDPSPQDTRFGPPVPSDMKSLGSVGRVRVFGSIPYKAAPTPKNPEAVTIDPKWVAENIVKVNIPQLNRTISWNKKGVDQVMGLFAAWQIEGVLDRVQTFDGSWAPRFVRGSTTTLSAHSWGTAFDVNAKWNGLGVQPPGVGSPGCVRELVTLAREYGFFWGGWLPSVGAKADGMHFELAVLY